MEQPKKSNKLFWKLLTAGLTTILCLGTITVITIMQFWLNGTLFKSDSVTKAIPAPLPYNQIAFIGNDDNLWLIAPDGSKLRQLTTDSQNYRLPVWSPNNSQVAFIGTAENKNTVYVSPVESGAPSPLFSDANAPLYLYWTPNSQAITFLTQTGADFALRQVDLATPTISRTLAEGTPLFWAWSPQGNKLLLHVGGAAKKAQLSWLDNQAEAKLTAFADLKPGNFQSPLWSTDGKSIFYVAIGGKLRGTLYKMDVATQERTIIAKIKGPTFMVLSPNGQYLAYMQFQQGNQPPFGTAYLVDTQGKKQTLLTKSPVASLYFSPDGTKLALLALGRGIDKGSQVKIAGLAAPLPQELTARWLVYYLKTGKLEILKSVNPTDDFSQTIPYFDQYHLSMTFWSPDSRYFLVADKDPAKDGQGFIWLTDSTLQEEPRKLAKGTMAVWSWR